MDYKEDFNDNEEWFAKIKEPLSRKQDIGADLAVPTDVHGGPAASARLAQRDQRRANVPNKRNLRPDLLEASVDPGRKFSAPVHVRPRRPRLQPGGHRPRHHDASTTCGIPAFKGQVSLFSDAQDGLGHDHAVAGQLPPRTRPPRRVQKAVDLVQEQKDKGQIRRFTGNDYADDLAAGNIAIAQAYSGDVVQLQADNPDLEFVVPESGGTTFVDTMVIPYTTQNQTGGRGVDELRLRPGQLRQADRLRPVRARCCRT